MSSYICDCRTYKKIYSGLHLFNNPAYPHTQKGIEQLLYYVTSPHFDEDHCLATLSSLYRVNVEAYNVANQEAEDTFLSKKQFKEMCGSITHISIYQFLKCLERQHHQMSDADIVEKSPIYTLAGNLISAVCKDIAHASKLYINAE